MKISALYEGISSVTFEQDTITEWVLIQYLFYQPKYITFSLPNPIHLKFLFCLFKFRKGFESITFCGRRIFLIKNYKSARFYHFCFAYFVAIIYTPRHVI